MSKNIETHNYYLSTYDFVATNGLEEEAKQEFGENWEAEDDVNQIKILLETVCPDKVFIVQFIEGLNTDYDIQIIDITEIINSRIN